MTGDPYQILGVSHDADAEQIKQAYRRLAKQDHPDLHPGDAEAARRMNEINEAYDLLKNPQAYQAYRQQQQQSAYQQAYRQQQSAYQQQNQQYYDPFGFWTSQQNGQNSQNSQNQNYYRYTYTYQPGQNQNEQNTQYQWTYHRPHRGGILRKLLSAYLILQLLGWLLSSCAYSYYPSYSSYGYASQPDSGYSDTYTGQQNGGYGYYGFGSGRQS